MLRYEQIVKDKLEDNNVKLLSMQNDRILIEINGEQKIFRLELVEDTIIIIKNVYDEIEYKIELR